MAWENEPKRVGLVKFEGEMRALGRPTTLVWALEAPPGHPFTLHAEYAVGRAIVYVQALPGGGWQVGPSSPLRATTPMPPAASPSANQSIAEDPSWRAGSGRRCTGDAAGLAEPHVQALNLKRFIDRMHARKLAL